MTNGGESLVYIARRDYDVVNIKTLAGLMLCIILSIGLWLHTRHVDHELLLSIVYKHSYYSD